MGDMVNSSKGKVILSVLYFGWMVSYIDRTVVSLSIVQMGKDLSLDASKLGIVLSAFFMGYALMQIPGGWLADRYGSRRVIVTAVLFWSIFTALTGLAWSLSSLIFIRLLFGIGEGGYPAASTKAISDYFPADKRTKAQSTMMSSNSLGAAVAPIICAPLLAVLGWRHVFWVISLLGIIVVISLLITTRKSSNYSNNDTVHKPNREEYFQLFRNSYLWKVLLIFFFINITGWGLSSWMPSYLMQELDINLKAVGIISAIPTLFTAVGMIISGRIINKVGTNAKYGVITAILIVGGSLYLMTYSSNIVQVIIYQSIASAFMSFIMCFIFTLPHRIMEQKVVGSAFGILNFGGQAAGIFSPIIMGALIASSNGSYKSAFLFLSASCLVAAIIACLLPSTKRKEVLDQPIVG
ncbi:MFS transporter [Gottfriedia sp. NPDC056225]|uniref:MFS transporter n=1 Tax=Gottfriedia sp. NPDC056225 TaxID=3345751 RepID=UPI0035DF6076